MSRPLRVGVLADRYQTSFVVPRQSRHAIERRRFLPCNLISSKLEAITIPAPRFAPGIDLFHAHNRIPLATPKFVMSFESHLPRRFAWPRDNAFTRFLDAQIASDRCRRIIAISHFAKRTFMAQHAHNPDRERLAAKLLVRYPNFVIEEAADALRDDTLRDIRLTFVGAHFGRKGGCVAVKVAERALARGLPVRVNIISSLTVGGSVWTDPAVEGFFEPYLRLLDLENVNNMGAQPNSVVLDTLRNSHFSILTTFGDTFGFSAIESMAAFTPVIATRICTLPEFIEDNVNGLLIDVATTDVGEWANPGYARRGEAVYANYFRDEVERIADATIDRLADILNAPATLATMRRNARETAIAMFDAKAATLYWDDFYERVAAESTSSPATLRDGLDVSAPPKSRTATT
jgi:glycosyltransferase involved in cell wall biosynthesis